MECWYRHPEFPYLFSDRGRAWRVCHTTPQKGHLLKAKPFDRVIMCNLGHKRASRMDYLLEEARRANPTPVTPAPVPDRTAPATPSHTEYWLPVADHPEVEVSNLGNVRQTTTRDPLKPFMLRGFLRVKIAGHPRRVHNLVAHLHLPNRPEGATHAFFLTSDRKNCATSNLTWEKPPDPPKIERKTGRPMSPQQAWAIVTKAKKGR